MSNLELYELLKNEMSREQYLENRRRQEKGVQEKGTPRKRSGQATDSKKMVPSEQNVGAIRAGRQEKEVSRRKAGQGEEK